MSGSNKLESGGKMKPLFLVAAAALAFAPFMAEAHGPSRQKVVETVEIARPPAEVWAKIGNFADMSWVPVVFSTEATKGNEIGSVRTLTLKDASGPKIVEELRKYDAAKMTYSYGITEVDVKVLPVNNYASTVTVKPGANGGSEVEWKAGFYRGYPLNDPPPELNDEASKAAVVSLYRSTLDALKTKLEATN